MVETKAPSTTPIVFFENFENPGLAQAIMSAGWDWQPSEEAAGTKAHLSLGPVVRIKFHEESQSLLIRPIGISEELGKLDYEEERQLRVTPWHLPAGESEGYWEQVSGVLHTMLDVLFEDFLEE